MASQRLASRVVTICQDAKHKTSFPGPQRHPRRGSRRVARGKATEAAASGKGPPNQPVLSLPVWRADKAPDRKGKKENHFETTTQTWTLDFL